MAQLANWKKEKNIFFCNFINKKNWKKMTSNCPPWKNRLTSTLDFSISKWTTIKKRNVGRTQNFSLKCYYNFMLFKFFSAIIWSNRWINIGEQSNFQYLSILSMKTVPYDLSIASKYFQFVAQMKNISANLLLDFLIQLLNSIAFFARQCG